MTSSIPAASLSPPVSKSGKFNDCQEKNSPTSVVALVEGPMSSDAETGTKHETTNESVSNLSKRMENAAFDEKKQYPLREIRSQIFRLIVGVGSLSTFFLDRFESDESVDIVGIHKREDDNETIVGMVNILEQILKLSDLLSLSLVLEAEMKIELNRRKYPVHLCKGKSGKYTEYSEHTGITKETGQDSMILNHNNEVCVGHDKSKYFISMIPLLTSRIREFASARDWHVYHTPRNLLLALTGELGELAELVQFKGDGRNCTLTNKEMEKLGQEMADVTIYLLRLADVCNFDLYDSIQRKNI